MSAIGPSITKIAAGSATPAPQALQGGSSGVFSTFGGGDFFDAILARLAAALPEDGIAKPAANTAAATQTTLSANTAKLSPDTDNGNGAAAQTNANPLALLQIALATKQTDAGGNIVLTDGSSLKDGVAAALKSTSETIQSLLNQLQNAAQTGDNADLFKKIIAKLQAKSETLQASLSSVENSAITMDTPVEEIPMPVLAALGLNPAQIADVTAKVEDLQKKLGRDITAGDLVTGIAGLIPPAPLASNVAAASFAPNATAPVDTNTPPATTPDSGDDMDALAAQLNGITVGGEETAKANAKDLKDKTPSAKLTPAGATPSPEKSTQPREILGLPDRAAEGLPQKDASAQTTQSAPDAFDAAMKAAKEKAAAAVAGINIKHQTQADTAASSAQGSINADTSSFAGYTSTGASSTSSTAQAANIVTTSATAGQTHPASATVAAMIVRNAKNGETKSLTIRLDPPELGSVSVRIQFGKDKAVKAHVTVEKSDTYMMLQRDAQSLERALQSAGLDPKENAISFELSQDNGNFARQGNNEANNEKFGGNHTNSGIDGDVGTEIETVNSSVNWRVDQATGRVRYNILA